MVYNLKDSMQTMTAFDFFSLKCYNVGVVVLCDEKAYLKVIEDE
jgi:hypothetical protein